MLQQSLKILEQELTSLATKIRTKLTKPPLINKDSQTETTEENQSVQVYHSFVAPQSVPVEQALADANTEQYQLLLNQLGVNTLGINQATRTKGTYQEVSKAITNFKERMIANSDRYHGQSLAEMKVEKTNLESKLEKIRDLITANEIEQLKRLFQQGEI
jgi:DNA-directed RNA polymerase specialized sigma54-like protein